MPSELDKIKNVRMQACLPPDLINNLQTTAKTLGIGVNNLSRHILTEVISKPLDTVQWETSPYHTGATQLGLIMPAWLKTAIATKAKELNMQQSGLVREILKQYLKENSQ